QRMMISRAFINKPSILFLDEPTDGLDPVTSAAIRKTIKEEAERGAAVLLTTHDMFEADELSDRVAFINEGEIVAEGTPERLMARLKGAERIFIQLAGADGDEAARLLRSLDGILAVDDRGNGAYEVECALGTDKRPDIARAIVNRGWSLLELRPVGMSLEEIFLKLTTE
ncbi:MAG: AAA family ATPase, partial [Anaerolineae bacterium]